MSAPLDDRIKRALAWKEPHFSGEDLMYGPIPDWATPPDFQGLLRELASDYETLRVFYNVAIEERNAAWAKLDRLEQQLKGGL